jgi:uncharacterized protein YndB with AHSA1/START domain
MTAATEDRAPRATRPFEVEGPVAAAGEIEIEAPVDVVWHVLTDVERWPAWNPDVRWVSLRGPLAPGAEFRWKAGPGTISSTLGQVDAPHRIAWTGTTLGVGAAHVWRLRERDGATLVQTEEAFTGVVARLLRRSLQKTLDAALANGLRHLRSEAEARAAAAVAAPPAAAESRP